MGSVCLFLMLAAAAQSQTGNDVSTEVRALLDEGARSRAAGEWKDAERFLHLAYSKGLAADSSGFAAAFSANELGSLLQDLGRSPDSERYYTLAMRLLEGGGRPDRLLIVVCNLASLYLDTGQYAKAERLDLEARIREAQPGLYRTRAMSNLASLHFARRCLEPAEALLLQCLSDYEMLGRREDAAAVLNNLALISIETGRLAEAIGRLERSVAAVQTGSPAPGAVYLRSLVNLGAAQALAGHRSEAVAISEQAAALVEQWLGSDSPAAAPLLAVCSDALKAAGEKSQAKRWRKKAQAIERASTPSSGAGMLVNIADLLPRGVGKPGQ